MTRISINKFTVLAKLDEMHYIIYKRLGDFDAFSKYIKALLSSPEQFGLSAS